MKTIRFKAVIRKEGINPYVDPPLGTGKRLLASRSPRVPSKDRPPHGVGRGRKKASIPVKVLLDGHPFRANLMPLGPKRTKAAPGTHHRLYLHGGMRQKAGKEAGDRIQVVLTLDLKPPVEPMNPALARALQKDPKARKAFEGLSPSHQKELKRYLNHLKSAEALQRNVDKVMKYLRQSRATWFGKKKPGQSG